MITSAAAVICYCETSLLENPAPKTHTWLESEIKCNILTWRRTDVPSLENRRGGQYNMAAKSCPVSHNLSHFSYIPIISMWLQFFKAASIL